MKIIFRQRRLHGSLSECGISDACLKRFAFGEDTRVTTLKTHHHNEFELHLIIQGEQTYESCGETFRVLAGSSLIIPPGVKHRMLAFEEQTEKYAISFKYDNRTRSACSEQDEPAQLLKLPELENCRLIDTPTEVIAAADFIAQEGSSVGALPEVLCENRLLEGLILLFRVLGKLEPDTYERPEPIPTILLMAKQFICDNIESAPSVRDAALYCHICEKQLTRIFRRHEGMTAFDYIRRERVEYAKALLSDKEQTLREISERMGFTNEYYFNEFFKQNSGMPPGAYRRMK